MIAQKTTLAVATVMLLVPVAGLRADTHRDGKGLTGGVVIGSHGGIGVWIGSSAPAPHRYEPEHRHVVVGSPWRHRVEHHYPPYRPPVVIVRPPVERPVVVCPAPPVPETEIVVWITNCNGSKTSVRLTRRGGWYIGPRGEYYDEMPTNEQLRAAYGF